MIKIIRLSTSYPLISLFFIGFLSSYTQPLANKSTLIASCQTASYSKEWGGLFRKRKSNKVAPLLVSTKRRQKEAKQVGATITLADKIGLNHPSSKTVCYKLIFECGIKPAKPGTVTLDYDDPFSAMSSCISLMNLYKSTPPFSGQHLPVNDLRSNLSTQKALLPYLLNYQVIKKMRFQLYKNLIDDYLDPVKSEIIQIKMLQLFAHHFYSRPDPYRYKKRAAYKQLLAHSWGRDPVQQKLPEVICKEIVSYLIDPFEIEYLKKELKTKRWCYQPPFPLPQPPAISFGSVEASLFRLSGLSHHQLQLLKRFHQRFVNNLMHQQLFYHFYTDNYRGKKIADMVYRFIILAYTVIYMVINYYPTSYLFWLERMLRTKGRSQFFFTLMALFSGKLWPIFITEHLVSSYPAFFEQKALAFLFRLVRCIQIGLGLFICCLYFAIAHWWRFELKLEKGWRLIPIFLGLALSEHSINHLTLSYLPCYLASDSLLSSLYWALLGAGFSFLSFYLVGLFF